MSSLDDLAKSNQEQVKLLGEIVKHLAKASGAPGAEPGFAGKKNSFYAMYQQFSAGSNLGMRGIAKGMMGGGYGAAGGAGLSKLGMAGIVASVGMELAKLPWKLKEFAEGLHQTNRSFATVSPAMAAVFMQSDLQDMMRSMRQGQAMAGTAAELAQSRGRLLNNLSPIETAWGNLKNRVGAQASSAMATFLEKSEWGKQLANTLNDIAGVARDADKQEAEDQWIRDLNKEVGDMVQIEMAKVQERRKPVRNAQQEPAFENPALRMAPGAWRQAAAGNF